jgi:hypothetical protein
VRDASGTSRTTLSTGAAESVASATRTAGRAAPSTSIEHYSANKQRYIDQAATRKRKLQRERMILLIEHLQSHGCVDCGETDPLVLEFDHRGDKAFNICSVLNERPWEAVLCEIEKCEVRCANCHRRRTARQRNSMRFMLVAEAD